MTSTHSISENMMIFDGILMKSKDPGSPDVTKTMKFIDFGGEKVTFRL